VGQLTQMQGQHCLLHTVSKPRHTPYNAGQGIGCETHRQARVQPPHQQRGVRGLDALSRRVVAFRFAQLIPVRTQDGRRVRVLWQAEHLLRGRVSELLRQRLLCRSTAAPSSCTSAAGYHTLYGSSLLPEEAAAARTPSGLRSRCVRAARACGPTGRLAVSGGLTRPLLPQCRRCIVAQTLLGAGCSPSLIKPLKWSAGLPTSSLIEVLP